MTLPSDEIVKRIVSAMMSYAGPTSYSIPIEELKQSASVTDEEFNSFFNLFCNRGLFTATGPPHSGGRINLHRNFHNELQRFGQRPEVYTRSNIMQAGNNLSSGDMMRKIIPILANSAGNKIPDVEILCITLGQILEFGSNTDEGKIVESLAVPWQVILERLTSMPPDRIHEIGWREWEEIIAASYVADGYDRVILTPRSRDKGKDVIAYVKDGIRLRVFDQVKAYKPGHRVDLGEVKGVLADAQTASFSKAFITTTSEFAPNILEDETVNAAVPYTLELRDRSKLLESLKRIAETGPTF